MSDSNLPTSIGAKNPTAIAYNITFCDSNGGLYVNETQVSSTLTQSGIGTNIVCRGVRRLTPVECERLQGFDDNYTDIPWKENSHSPDSARYKALGNSMPVSVMRWIGERIRSTV